ncbi:hypothetical protein ACFYZI_19730 [Streptomyces griseorubiginosus]|uniref:hypothetical protein n=1 Tax=Streptomyces griseorubiginosus TaxID=67304 RepID=UPI0036768AFD
MAVLTPVLFGATAVILLAVGYALRMLDAAATFAATVVTVGWIFGFATGAAMVVAAVGLLLTVIRNREHVPAEEPSQGAVRPVSHAVRGTLGLASSVAGARRTYLREEWAAVLAGDPESGVVLSSSRRMRYALGFLWAALRMRLHDLAAPVWAPVDWLLSTDSRTNGFIAFVVGAQVVYIQHEDGLHALLTEGWGWCAGCGVALRLFAGWLRRIRGIELATTQSGQ